MSEKNDTNESKKQEASNLTNDYLQRASYLGTILPLLDVFYEIVLEKKIKKYNLNIVKEFWIFFGLLIFTTLFYYFGVRFEEVIFFLLATIFTLIIFNLDFFKNRLVSDEDSDIKKFIQNIEDKDLDEVGKFIKQYRRKLTDSEIQVIIDSQHGNNWIVYDHILKNQKVTQKNLIYIVEKNRLDICGEELFIKYLKKFNLGLSFDTYLFLANRFKDDGRIMKILNLYNPSYIRKKSLFRTIAKFTQSFYFSVKQGTIGGIIAFFSFLITIISLFGINSKQMIPSTVIAEPITVSSLIFFINLIFSFLIIVMIIFLIITALFIALSRLLWFILGFFTPDVPQI